MCRQPCQYQHCTSFHSQVIGKKPNMFSVRAQLSFPIRLRRADDSVGSSRLQTANGSAGSSRLRTVLDSVGSSRLLTADGSVGRACAHTAVRGWQGGMK